MEGFNPAISTNVAPALMARHFLLWTTTTIAFRYLLPPIQRLLLPKSTASYAKLDKFLVEHHHEQFEALSPICWMVHIGGQTLLSLTSLLLLSSSSNPAAIRAFGGVTALNAAGGCLLIGSHGLIDRHPTMEKLLDFSGTSINHRSSAEMVCLPQYSYALFLTTY